MKAPTAIVIEAADAFIKQLDEQDAKVDRSEGEGLSARWAFGKTLLKQRDKSGKLPNKLIGSLAVRYDKSRTELEKRMQFAELYPDLRSALRSIKTWHEFTNPKPATAQNRGDYEWYTPPEYIAAAKAVLGEIDLDPASSEAANDVVQAKKFYTAKDDGLTKQWAGTVWMNPPYSQPAIGNFCDKLMAELEEGHVTAAITLTNNATETEWGQLLLAHAAAVTFPRGRVKFWAPDKVSAPLQGQMVCYFGNDPSKFNQFFDAFGVSR